MKPDQAELEFTFLGTGTSQGVPVIGCHCEVCSSADPKDQRLRTSGMIRYKGQTIVIDAGPDFRQQMLREQVDQVDAILITHEHNDHVIGLDDVRPFNFMTRSDMPVYATRWVQAELRQRFAYIFTEKKYPGAPSVIQHDIEKEDPIQLKGFDIMPIEVMHGRLPVMGFRIGNFAYLTDVKTIEAEEMNKLKGLDALVINALHHSPHHSHLNLEEALEMIERINPKRAYLTHISHRMGLHKEVDSGLPEGVWLGYDGMRVNVLDC